MTRATPAAPLFGFVDLFSGAGGMSCGFHRHSAFRVLAAADAEIGKPGSGVGTLQCNQTYERNIGFPPTAVDLSRVAPGRLRETLGLGNARVHVLSVCPPCTGFSRANPGNHTIDDPRNGLVAKAARFAVALGPDIIVMENARELLRGNFQNHFESFRRHLEANGYHVDAAVLMLSRFGLPQIRERAIVIAARKEIPILTLDTLWKNAEVDARAVTVRAAFEAISRTAPNADEYPGFASDVVRRRLEAVPADGGSWIDLLDHPQAGELLTDGMKRIIASRRIGSHPDAYGRMAWDRPAPTIKRECAHTGNGRYAHPELHRLCTVREMAALQGFPGDFEFRGRSMANHYRHIGDAVPPLISHQLAHLCHGMLAGYLPEPENTLLAGTHLRRKFIRRNRAESRA